MTFSATLPEAPAPFVLIDGGTSRPSRLYRKLLGVVQAARLDEVAPALERLREAQRKGHHAAGYLAYEAGFAFEPRLGPLAHARQADDAPLLWFGLFDGYDEIAIGKVPDLLPDSPCWLGEPRALIGQEEYAAAFAQVGDLIQAGDIYQANLTFPCVVAWRGDPRALYRAVRPRAEAAHGALVMTGAHWHLSFSPELFFTLQDGALTARPMKGTATRSADPATDAAHAEALRADPKQRAENLMIVDLLRNDLSRVAEAGSVAVPELFAIEHYPTVHHMTSTVTARLRAGYDAIDALQALFPCGSITGAPKMRAMEVIRQVESGPRGIYTGSIGTLDPSGNAAFNVAIRTVSAKYGETQGTLGLGSGIVADSERQAEWLECLAKGRFLSLTETGDID